jgi:P27 family predicted phage terminase small subunit
MPHAGGRPAAPRALKVLRGERPSRINTDEPTPIEGRPLSAPVWLSKVGREEWNRVVPHLVHMQILNDADLPAFAAYCEAYARWRLCLAELWENPSSTILGDRDRGQVRNPVYMQIRDAEMALLRYAREFGLTPSARQGIRVEHVIRGDAGRLLAQ